MVKQSNMVVRICGRGYLPHGRQEAERRKQNIQRHISVTCFLQLDPTT
jgi:hypothetical protein